MLDFSKDVLLKNFTSIKLGGEAKLFVEANSEKDVESAVKYAQDNGLKIFVLGGGNNSIGRDEGYDGLIFKNNILGIKTTGQDSALQTFQVGAGEDWDNFVKFTVEQNLSGIEALSAIPGTVGASPVQNIGAYGQEVSETIQSLRAYDIENRKFVELQNDQCEFGYRSSIFREEMAGRYIITQVTFKLSKSAPRPPFYKAVENYLDQHNITDFTSQIIRQAVMEIRADKLPDPKIKPNAGSFFKNAIVDLETYRTLVKQYPDMPSYPMNDKVKIPTGWLIDQAGLKGQEINGIKIHDKNALVLINQSAKSYSDLATARQQIIDTVKDKFGITIEQEPLEIV